LVEFEMPSHIPEELLLEIMEMIEPLDLKKACLVSKTFARVVKGILYQFLSISVSKDGYPVEMLATTLMERPDLAELVQSVTLGLTERRSKTEYDAQYRNRIMSYAKEVVSKPPVKMKKWKARLRNGDEITWAAVLLACTPNLRALHLEIYEILREPRQRLFSQKKIGNYKGASDIIKTDSLRCLRVGGFQLQWECFKRMQLEELILDAEANLPFLREDMPDISISILECIHPAGLISWHAIPTGLTTFSDFITKCPHLKVLRLRYLDAWTKQNDARGFSNFARIAVQLRPLEPTLEVLEFVAPKDIPDWEMYLAHVLPFDPANGCCLSQFHSLKKLELPQRSLFIGERQWTFQDGLPPNLEVLTIHAAHPTIIRPLKQLHSDTNTLKNLRELRLQRSIEWMCVPLGIEDMIKPDSVDNGQMGGANSAGGRFIVSF
jgi:hypothetical protein